MGRGMRGAGGPPHLSVSPLLLQRTDGLARESRGPSYLRASTVSMGDSWAVSPEI